MVERQPGGAPHNERREDQPETILMHFTMEGAGGPISGNRVDGKQGKKHFVIARHQERQLRDLLKITQVPKSIRFKCRVLLDNRPTKEVGTVTVEIVERLPDPEWRLGVNEAYGTPSLQCYYGDKLAYQTSSPNHGLDDFPPIPQDVVDAYQQAVERAKEEKKKREADEMLPFVEKANELIRARSPREFGPIDYKDPSMHIEISWDPKNGGVYRYLSVVEPRTSAYAVPIEQRWFPELGLAQTPQAAIDLMVSRGFPVADVDTMDLSARTGSLVWKSSNGGEIRSAFLIKDLIDAGVIRTTNLRNHASPVDPTRMLVGVDRIIDSEVASAGKRTQWVPLLVEPRFLAHQPEAETGFNVESVLAPIIDNAAVLSTAYAYGLEDEVRQHIAAWFQKPEFTKRYQFEFAVRIQRPITQLVLLLSRANDRNPGNVVSNATSQRYMSRDGYGHRTTTYMNYSLVGSPEPFASEEHGPERPASIDWDDVINKTKQIIVQHIKEYRLAIQRQVDLFTHGRLPHGRSVNEWLTASGVTRGTDDPASSLLRNNAIHYHPDSSINSVFSQAQIRELTSTLAKIESILASCSIETIQTAQSHIDALVDELRSAIPVDGNTTQIPSVQPAAGKSASSRPAPPRSQSRGPVNLDGLQGKFGFTGARSAAAQSPEALVAKPPVAQNNNERKIAAPATQEERESIRQREFAYLQALVQIARRAKDELGILALESAVVTVRQHLRTIENELKAPSTTVDRLRGLIQSQSSSIEPKLGKHLGIHGDVKRFENAWNNIGTLIESDSSVQEYINAGIVDHRALEQKARALLAEHGFDCVCGAYTPAEAMNEALNALTM